MMVLEATQMLQCHKVKGFKATKSLHLSKNESFGKKTSQNRSFFQGDKASKIPYR
jgi:hypothetical protein